MYATNSVRLLVNAIDDLSLFPEGYCDKGDWDGQLWRFQDT